MTSDFMFVDRLINAEFWYTFLCYLVFLSIKWLCKISSNVAILDSVEKHQELFSQFWMPYSWGISYTQKQLMCGFYGIFCVIGYKKSFCAGFLQEH